MELTNNNLKSKNDLQLRIFMAAISSVLIVLGVMQPLCSVFAVLINVVYFIAVNTTMIYYQLFFLLPFASIFKNSVGGTSFFTYLEMLAVLKMMLSVKKVKSNFVVFYAMFVAYILFGLGTAYTTMIKQAIIPLLFLCFFDNEPPEQKSFITNYSFGLIVSSIVASFIDYIPGLERYVRFDVSDADRDLERFGGLYSDPNYYTLNLILAIICLLILYSKKRMGWQAFALSGILVFFGIQTISKSFLIMFAVVAVFFVYTLIKNKKLFAAAVVILAIAVVVILVIMGKITIFNNFLDRMEVGGDKNDITTGRTAIWGDYIRYFINNPLKLVFGRGVSSLSLAGMVPHNTYIDFLYYYGLVGTLIFIPTIFNAINYNGKIKIKLVNAIPIICVLILIFMLSCLMFFDFVFVLALSIYMLIDHDSVKNDLISQTGEKILNE